MSEGRDPAIKLFGTEIPLPEEEWDVGDFAPAIELPVEGEKDTFNEKSNNEVSNSVMGDTDETPNPCGLSNSTKNFKKASAEAAKSAEGPNPEHGRREENTSGEEDKALKKPDKILPCPRCDSMDTKFCYYNNYNVNQPRHFCKNCQRYWTAGGTMRNVPVGAGRRKNKHCSLSYRQTILTSDSLVPVQMGGPDPATNASKRPLMGNSTILKFGPDALSETMGSMLNLEEKKIDSYLGSEKREEPSCSSSVTTSNVEENGFPWQQWPYGWNPGGIPGQDNFNLQSPFIAVPAFCAPAFPFPFVPASFWSWSGGPWNLPWVGNGNSCLSSPSSSTRTGNCSGNGSPTLGKHSREAERSLWIPKTLRINDPDEAAKSSIFATLGIKLDECGRFKSFRSNTRRRDASDAVKMLRSNPAALSRSQSFLETA